MVLLCVGALKCESSSSSSSATHQDKSEYAEGDLLVLKAQARRIVKRLQIRVKIYVSLWQIVSVLPLALDLQFPSAYNMIAAFLDLLNLGVSRSALVTCSSHSDYDAIDVLVVDTVYPMVIVGLLWLAQTLHLLSRCRVSREE